VIKARLKNAEPRPWKYRDLGSMAAVDRHSAFVSMHGVRLAGRFAWLLWLVVHITFMTGFRNRFHWFQCCVGTGRLERAIVGDLDRLVAQNRRRRTIARETMETPNDAATVWTPRVAALALGDAGVGFV
jgi:hypothetical protein